jgi:hypothetical protein
MFSVHVFNTCLISCKRNSVQNLSLNRNAFHIFMTTQRDHQDKGREDIMWYETGEKLTVGGKRDIECHWRTQGAGGCRRAAPPPKKRNLKKHRLFKHRLIKCFT